MKIYNSRSLANLNDSSINIEERTAEFVFSTGHKGLRSSWDGNYYEELSMREENVNLENFINGPLLINHNSSDINNIIGRVLSAKIENGVGIAKVRFGSDEESDKYFKRVQDKILTSVSVGYRIHDYEETSKRGDKTPSFLITRWEPLELSLVCVPFDPKAKLRKEEDLKEGGMPLDENRKNESVDNTLLIMDLVLDAGLDRSLAKRFVNLKLGTDEVRHLVDDLKKSIQQDMQTRTVYTGSNAVITQDEIETKRESVKSALLHRADPSHKLEKRGNEYATMTLFEMAKTFLRSSEIEGSRSKIATRALAQSDFGVIMADIANARLVSAYKKEGIRTFQPFCTPETLPDYRPKNELKFDETSSDLSKVLPGSEYTYGSFGESELLSYRLYKYGKIFSITDEIIVNDQFNAIDQFFNTLGDLSARNEERLVYQEFLGGKWTDGLDLYHEKHGNISKNAVSFGDDAIDDMEEAMRSHFYGQSKEEIIVNPKFIIFGKKQARYIRRYLKAIFQATREEDVKTFLNDFVFIKTRQIANADWYCISDPNLFPSIKTLTMEGANGPETTYRQGFEVDGVEVKIKHIFGAKAVDYRGVYKNIGKLPEKKEK